MRTTRLLKPLVIAAAMAIISVLTVTAAPVAGADTLSNGLTVSCSQDSDLHATCVVGGCPRVHGDYVVDAVHAMINGGDQSENDFKCINGQTARYGVDNNRAPVNIGVQGCRKKDLEGDWCTPYANYTFTPPAAAKPADTTITCPAGSQTPTVPAGQQCAPAKAVDVTCPAGSVTPTVPAGQTCSFGDPPKDAVTMTTSKAGGGKIDVNIKSTAPISGSCAYSAAPTSFDPLGVLPTINKTVDIKANGTAVIPAQTAPPIGTSYHLEVTCTGDFHGTSVTFGHSTLDL